MNKQFIARQSIVINAPASKIWDALVNPDIIKQYMFGTNAISDWQESNPIVFKGEWQVKIHEDKGVILRLEPERLIQYIHLALFQGFQTHRKITIL